MSGEQQIAGGTGEVPGAHQRDEVGAPPAPAVSVLLPVYNAESTIAEALRSLRDQTFTDFEVVVVDDGSTDATPGIIAAAAMDDPRLRCIRHAVNQGLVASLVDGMAEVRGEFVARLDADDVCLPRRLELQVAALRADRRRVLCWTAYGRRTLGTDEDRGDIVPAVDHAPMQLMLATANRILHSATMFRTDAVRAVGGYDGEWYPAEDYDLWCRLLAHGTGVGVAEPLVIWRMNPQGISRSNVALQAGTVERRAAIEQRRLGCPPPRPGASRRAVAVHERRLAAAVRAELRTRGLPTRGLPEAAVKEMLHDLRESSRAMRWTVVATVSPTYLVQFWWSRVARRTAATARRP